MLGGFIFMFQHTYIRSLVFSVVIVVGVFVRMFQNYGDWTRKHVVPILLTFVVTATFVTMLMWLFTAVARSLGLGYRLVSCRLVVGWASFFIMAMLVLAHTRLHHQ